MIRQVSFSSSFSSSSPSTSPAIVGNALAQWPSVCAAVGKTAALIAPLSVILCLRCATVSSSFFYFFVIIDSIAHFANHCSTLFVVVSTLLWQSIRPPSLNVALLLLLFLSIFSVHYSLVLSANLRSANFFRLKLVSFCVRVSLCLPLLALCIVGDVFCVLFLTHTGNRCFALS